MSPTEVFRKLALEFRGARGSTLNYETWGIWEAENPWWVQRTVFCRRALLLWRHLFQPSTPPNREAFVCLPSLFELHRIQRWVWTHMTFEFDLNFLGLVIRLGEWAISCLEKHNGLKCLIAGKQLMIFIKETYWASALSPPLWGEKGAPKFWICVWRVRKG